MRNVRFTLCWLLAVALAHYSVLATGVAHAHDHVGPHGPHVMADFDHHNHDDHGHSHDHEPVDSADDEGSSDAEPPLHTHSVPQFAPVALALSVLPIVAGGKPVGFTVTQALAPDPPDPFFRPPRA